MSRSLRGFAVAAGLALVLAAAPCASAAQTQTRLDENGDGRQETTLFRDGDRTIRAEVDRDGDGKTDRWVDYDNAGKRARAEEDRDHDGKTDVWVHYGKGFVREAKDSDGDGKFDEISTRMKGRLVLLKEEDRNKDGRIDKRKWSEWGSRRIAPGQPELPGYQTIWREEDNDYDGKIDQYFMKGDRAASAQRIGKSIDGAPFKTEEERAAEPAAARSGGDTQSPSEQHIARMNEKYELDG